MKIENEIDIYEINGIETIPVVPGKHITIKSHWNYSDRFVIVVDGTSYTVLRDDIERAIQNACNHK